MSISTFQLLVFSLMRTILHTDCMSSEESLSEPDSQDTGDTWGLGKKNLCVPSLPWRSVEVNTLKAPLDQRLSR